MEDSTGKHIVGAGPIHPLMVGLLQSADLQIFNEHANLGIYMKDLTNERTSNILIQNRHEHWQLPLEALEQVRSAVVELDTQVLLPEGEKGDKIQHHTIS